MWSSTQAWAIICLCLATNTAALVPRADCKTVTVESGNSCGTLATKCGISANDFTKYNPDKNLCATLTPGMRVCCSAGSLPDIRPKKNGDGSCNSHKIKSGETCSSLAAANGLKTEDISKFNDKTTWGWAGCDRIMADMTICLSDGNPPMPAAVENAVCGPQKPGTKPPSNGQKLADLNPCPLKTCCNIWGQCGITPDYCKAESGPTGNPGTAPKGKNGCISNCGTDVVNNKSPPSSFTKVGYYESWNFDRQCVNMRAATFDGLDYTHVHWSFASLSPDLSISINDTFNQWADFTKLKAKKIVSFGGWGISTDPKTYNVLRNAMNPSSAGKFADNIVSFVNKNNLDGVDIDWEYPGAPDIPGIPAGLDSDAPNYLQFLKTLRSKLPKGKSMSIAAPASYWYLKAFPIAEMSEQLDYIVYMTYDLHGQWDHDNKWAQEGCAGGNCLRSHVNLTETNYALAMITKAGVPSNKINVGVSSYGRSFGMTNGGCTGPMCTFGGSNTASTATPGRCSGVGGYISNAEIYDLISNDPSAKTWYDKDSNSDILTYGGKDWVAFMSDATKSSRTGYYKGLNFAGTIDWAVDLQIFSDDDGDPYGVDDQSDWDFLPMQTADEMKSNPAGAAGSTGPCNANYNTIEDLDKDFDKITDNCKAIYMVDVLSKSIDGSLKQYDDLVKHSYDSKFNTYAGVVADSAAKTVNDWIWKHGEDYFTCQVAEMKYCCSAGSCKDGCQLYCTKDKDFKCTQSCNSLGQCSKRYLDFLPEFGNQTYADQNGQALAVRGDIQPPSREDHFEWIKADEPCPPNFSKRGASNTDHTQSVWWNLKQDKTDAFYADLAKDTGIPKDKIKAQDYIRIDSCSPAEAHGDKLKSGCGYIGIDYGIPMPDHFGKGDVGNPKKVVEGAYKNATQLNDQLKNANKDVKAGTYKGDVGELIDSVSITIFMIADAVDQMETIKETADKIDEEKKKAIILAFIGALLFFIPIAGEVIGTVAETANIGLILSIIGVAGGAAYDIYTIVKDPQNRLLAIFGLILAPLGLADLGAITKAANLRRGMTEAEVAALGGKVSGRVTIAAKFAKFSKNVSKSCKAK